MNPKKRGSIAILSAIVALGGATSTTLASTHPHAVANKSYSCSENVNQPKCKNKGVGGTRVTGGTTGGTRVSGGTNGNGKGTGAGGRSGAGAKGSGGNGAGANGAGANGSSPTPGQSLPVTGFGGTAQDVGASPRSAAAGSQPVVVGLASSPGSQRVTALPATGGGVPSQPASPLLALIAAALAALGLGLRKVAAHF
jgi:hypothetical protein